MRRFSNVIDDFHIFYHFGLKYSSVCYAIDEYIKRQVNVKKNPAETVLMNIFYCERFIKNVLLSAK